MQCAHCNDQLCSLAGIAVGLWLGYVEVGLVGCDGLLLVIVEVDVNGVGPGGIGHDGGCWCRRFGCGVVVATSGNGYAEAEGN